MVYRLFLVEYCGVCSTDNLEPRPGLKTSQKFAKLKIVFFKLTIGPSIGAI